MKMYHFTAEHLLPQILKQGLTLGVFPYQTEKGILFIPHRQWLTLNPDRYEQSWNTQVFLKYSRSTVRLTIEIPSQFTENIIPALQYVSDMNAINKALVTEWDGSDKWAIYKGDIPPRWIAGVKEYKQVRKARR